VAIFAYSLDALSVFNNILHDLYFDKPERGLDLRDGRLHFRLTDQDLLIRKDSVSEYFLCICEIESAEVEGDLDALPDEIELNKILFEPKKSLLTLEAVHPLRIVCLVRKLHLELDQLA